MRRSHDQIETDTLLRESAREFAREQEAGNASGAGETGSWQAYVEAGWPGMALGEDSGGIGADLTQCCLVLQEAGRALLPESVTADILIAPRLARHAPRIADLMSELLAGKARFALVLPDENGISETGDGRIEGRSGLVPGGDQATHLLIPVGTGSGTRLALAHNDASGVAVRPARLMDGRGAARFELSGLPADGFTVLATGETARAIAEELEALSICGLLSEGLGAFEAAFEMTVDYVQIRQQFKQPLAAFQAVEHIIADVYCELEKARSLHMAMVGSLDAPGRADAGAVARARFCHARNVLHATGQLIQISGGIALTEDYKLGRIYRRLQADAALFGGVRRATDIISGAPPGAS